MPFAITPLTSLITGASPADSRISVISPAARPSSSSSSIASAIEESSLVAFEHRGLDVLGGRDGGPHVEAGHDRDVVDRAHVGGVRHRHQQRVVADERDRDRPVALGRLARDQVHRAEVDVELVQVEVVESEALGRRPRELVARDRPATASSTCSGVMPLVRASAIALSTCSWPA